MTERCVDLNADLGEGTGNDDAMLAYVTSANIACGFHAGGPATMLAAVRACMHHGVAIGAHPGFNDRANFGRTPLPVTPTDTYELVLYQVAALGGFTRA